MAVEVIMMMMMMIERWGCGGGGRVEQKGTLHNQTVMTTVFVFIF